MAAQLIRRVPVPRRRPAILVVVPSRDPKLAGQEPEQLVVPRTDAAGLAIIQHFEGFAAMPYRCPAGYWTVGFGHLIQPGEDFSHGISRAQAERLLLADVAVAERAVWRLITVPLNSNQFSALVSWTFNLGGGALQRSTLRRRLNRGDYDGTPAQMLRWNKAGGRVLAGLTRRRQAEAALFTA